MRKELEFVQSYPEVLENAISFQKIIGKSNELTRRLSTFQHWYYFDQVDAFAPSKFIGYKSNSLEDYLYGTDYETGYMDGRDTEVELRELFVMLPKEHEGQYMEKLMEFFKKFDKRPNIRSRIHLRR